MKKVNYAFVILTFLFSFVSFASASQTAASDCPLEISLLNQDPIHAVPGEYVDVVFQVEGIDDSKCGTVNFELTPEYPFSLDPNVNPSRTLQSGTYTSSYNSQATIPFSLRVDPTALNKNYDLTVRYSSTAFGDSILKKDFDISVEDVKGEFELFVDDYDIATKTITFGILNVGKNDVEALVVDLPKQSVIDVKGSSKAIVGTLDANQDTTFSYEATPSNGNVTLVISYNDENGERRSVEQTVYYDSSYFENRIRDVKQKSAWSYAFPLIILVLVGWFVKRKFFPKKKDNKH